MVKGIQTTLHRPCPPPTRQFMRQIVLVPGSSVHHNGRAYSEGRYRQYSHYHPVRTGVLGVHSEQVALLIWGGGGDLVSDINKKAGVCLSIIVIYYYYYYYNNNNNIRGLKQFLVATGGGRVVVGTSAGIDKKGGRGLVWVSV